MTVTMLKGKIHRAVVMQAELDYVGSITVDPELMEAAGIFEYEKVQIVDVENGSRFETYTIAGEPGSGMICLNGAAARMVQAVDSVANINKTKAYIRKAFEKQMAGCGFSFVEIMAPCPTNWGMTALGSIKRMQDEVLKLYPVGEYIDGGAK